MTWMTILWLAGSAGVLALILAARRRRGALARELHELRGALTSARLAVDLLPMLDLDRPSVCFAASSELERSYNSLGEFEDLLHAKLIALPAKPAAMPRRARPPYVEPRPELERLALIWSEAARRRGRNLEFVWAGGDEELLVNGPRRRFAEVVTNLLANALRHGDGDVTLTARVRSDHLRVEVHDEGPGLAAPLSEISRRRCIGRHGHGLAVATKAATALGGSLRSAPARSGANFVFSVPAVHVAASAPPEYPRPRSVGAE